MKGRVFALTALAAGVSAAAWGAGGGEALTLRDAVALALRENPAIRSATGGQELARADLAEATAGRLPLLQASETFTRGTNPVFVFGATLEQSRFGPGNFQNIEALNDPAPANSFRTALTARWTLFDQLQTSTRVTRSRFGTEQADQQRRFAEQQVRFQVLRSYYGVLYAQARRAAAEEAIRSAEADASRSRTLFETGTVVRSDLLAAEVQLAEFRQERIQAAGEVAMGLAALNASLGLPVVTAHRLAGELSDRSFDPGTEDELLRLALERRPDYLNAVSARRSAQAAVRGAAAAYLPRVETFGTFGGSGRDPGIESTDYTLGAVVSVELFEPGRRPRLEKARAAASIAEAEREQTASRISVEVVQALQRFWTARERLAVAAAAVEQAREALRIGQDRYQEGLSTMTEVLR
ncbi:MAG: TolC family protein, partial [Deltaproteobacteria bacterium]|nr:TolC family protein [Deltaproteobacteria bacterium]